MDQHQNISMVVHQITDQYKTVQPVIDDEEPIEETGICFIPSMCTHEISYLDTPAESSKHQVSMIAHYQHKFENSGIGSEDDALSMVCHQTSEHYNVQECHVVEQDQELVEDEETYQDENLPFISSMVNHQLSDIDTLLEISEIPVSMATHVIATIDMEDTIESPQTISMIAHQILNEDESIVHVAFSIIDTTREETDTPDHEQILMEDTYFTPSVCTLEISKTKTQLETTEYEFKEDEEEQKIQSIDILDPELGENKAMDEPTFISSMVVHQLAPLDNVLELSEIPLTMAAHVIITDWENNLDTQKNISMIVHQIMNHDIDMEQTVSKPSDSILLLNTVENVFIPSMCTHEMSYLDTPAESLECQVSMVTHYQHTPEDRFEHEDDVLSMVCHHGTIHDSVKQYQDEEISETKLSKDEDVVLTAESTFSSSMVAHQLPTLDPLLEFSDIPASMAAHAVNTNDMDEGETHQNISMMAHQDTNENKSILQDAKVFINTPKDEFNVIGACEKNNKMAAEQNFLHAESVMIPALSTDQDSLIKVPYEHQEFSTSGSAYNGDKSTTASEQIKDNPGAMVCSTEENILEVEEEIYPVALKRNYHDTIEVQIPFFLSSMVSHQLPYMETPNEFPDFLVSSAAHGNSLIIQEDQGLVSSMLTHQTIELNLNDTIIEEAEEEVRECLSSLVSNQLAVSDVPSQDENFLVTAVAHGSPLEESHFNMQSGLAHHTRINSDTKDVGFMTSLASHHLSLLSPCEQLESDDCITSMAAHQDMSTIEEKDFVSMATHIASNDGSEVNLHQDQDDEEISKPNEIIESEELVENITCSYTEGSHKEDLPQKEEDSSNSCQGKITVGTEEETTETYDNFENAADNNEEVNSYSSKLDRILELQRLVEDEIEEFENKKKNNSKIIENNVERTETHIVSNVKNVEFQSCMVIHQHQNEGYDAENSKHIVAEQFIEEYKNIKNEEHWTDDESYSSSSVSVNSVICTTSEKLKCNDKQKKYNEDENSSETNSDHEDEDENVIKASCTLENNSPVVITTNTLTSKCLELLSTEQDVEHDTERQDVMKDNQQEENDNLNQSFEEDKEDFDGLKMNLRKIPRRSSNATTKIRETELLNSLFKGGLKEVEEKCKKKQQERPRKSSMTLATFNESVTKQTYKIRFKVSLNKDSSKSSVLQYLLGCFGGEKLFHQK
eukprot:TRINITY_DN8003_c0_g1_i6.p1 TRINITY_DN8003_c0_g1~~TRINITY_DN8003_c0_g1_i6.p1  ORF type:complete len:1239 (+),score=305.51 TRINITY_DN8003_c0_g1_i6:156-3719(+)